jgi:hypothetical protein
MDKRLTLRKNWKPGMTSTAFARKFFFWVFLCGIGRITIASDLTEKANYGFHFLTQPINPRSIAAGSAGVADGWGGFSFYNPAGGWLIERPYISVEYGQYPAGDLNRATFETAWKYANWFWGGDFSNYSVPFPPATEQGPDENLQAWWQQSIFALSGGYGVDALGVGATLTGVLDRIDVYKAWGISLSAGGVYRILPGHLTAGAALMNATEALKKISSLSSSIKTTTGFLDSTSKFGQGAGMPLWGAVGASWCDTLRSIPYSAHAQFMYQDQGSIVMVPVGIEVWPLPAFAVRIGKRFGHDTELLAVGCGVRTKPVDFNFAVTIPKLGADVELQWIAGLTYALRNAKTAAAPGAAARPARQAPAASPVSITPVEVLRKPAAANYSAAQAGASDSTAADIKVPAPQAAPAPGQIAPPPVSDSTVAPAPAPAAPADSAVPAKQ